MIKEERIMASARRRRGRGELLHEMGFSLVGCIRNLTLNVEYENGRHAEAVISVQNTSMEYDTAAFDDADLTERIEPDGQTYQQVPLEDGDRQKAEVDFSVFSDEHSTEGHNLRKTTEEAEDNLNNSCSVNTKCKFMYARESTEIESVYEFARETERTSTNVSNYEVCEQKLKPTSEEQNHSIETPFRQMPTPKETYGPAAQTRKRSDENVSEPTDYVAKEFLLGTPSSRDKQFSRMCDAGIKEKEFLLGKSNREGKEFPMMPDYGTKEHYPNRSSESVNMNIRENMYNKTDFSHKFSSSEHCLSKQSSDDFPSRQPSRGCFVCGKEGHISRNCPSKTTSMECQNCSQEGHKTSHCPAKKASMACRNCGLEGHMARECSAEMMCRHCRQVGHVARDCVANRTSMACYNCGQEGHLARDCPSKKFVIDCRHCGQEGHMARECPNSKSAIDDKVGDRPPPYIPPPPPDDDDHIFETLLKGINFNKYDEIPVECTGRNAPASGMNSFYDFGLSEVVQTNIRKTKYDKPTPIQKWAIPVILDGRDVMACAVTGSGKTAAFLLPILTKMIRSETLGSSSEEVQMPEAVILAPTRELAVQINNEARKFAHDTMINSVVVYGGVSTSYLMMQLNKGAHIVVATPGRFLDLVRKGKISLSKVKHFVLDEADRMLDLGFLPDIHSIVDELGMPGKTCRQMLMFSATFPDEIQKLASEMLNDYIFITVGCVGGASQDIEQVVHLVPQSEKRQKLFEILTQLGNVRVVVFVEMKRNADFLANQLTQSKFPTASIHGDLSQKDREDGLRDFRSGRAAVLVATSVAARGLDIPEVKHVINYDMPSTIEEYVHRIGRTGRCGNLGKATSFFDPDRDSSLTRALVKVLVDAKQVIPDWMEEMAVHAVGTGGFAAHNGGRFGARDNRRPFGRGKSTIPEGDPIISRNVANLKQQQPQQTSGQEQDESWDD